jgi:hypothetical protein
MDMLDKWKGPRCLFYLEIDATIVGGEKLSGCLDSEE